MAVELVQHKGVGILSKREVLFSQWIVCENRRELGILSMAPGSRICFMIPNLDPREKKRIEAEALALTGWDSMAESMSAVDVPEELKKSEDDEDYDDIDT